MIVFPFRSTWRWLVASRPIHLIEATKEHMASCAEPFCTILEARSESLVRVVRWRLLVFVFLNIGVIGAATTFAIDVIGEDPAFQAFISQLFEWISSISAALLVLFLILNRVVGQLEADLVAALALGTARRPAEPN